MKIVQLLYLSGTPPTPPNILALGDDGSIWLGIGESDNITWHQQSSPSTRHATVEKTPPVGSLSHLAKGVDEPPSFFCRKCGAPTNAITHREYCDNCMVKIVEAAKAYAALGDLEPCGEYTRRRDILREALGKI